MCVCVCVCVCVCLSLSLPLSLCLSLWTYSGRSLSELSISSVHTLDVSVVVSGVVVLTGSAEQVIVNT